MAGQRSPYETLGVSPDAEPIVIEAAYKALIRKYHPDLWLRDPDAQDRAATINQAFAILRDPEARSVCDQQLRAMRNAARAASYRQARPRSARGARWGIGWLVALVVAVATITPWDKVSIPSPQLVSRPAAPSMAADATSETRTQEVAKRQAKELSGHERPLPDGLVQLATKAREQQDAFLASIEEPVASASAGQGASQPARRANARKKIQRAPRTAAHSADAEFREREGLIY